MTNLCYPSHKPLLSAEQALERIASAIIPLSETETVALSDALGRVIAESPQAPQDIPPQANAAMDGYGLNSAQILPSQTFRLRVVGTAWAGQPFVGELADGECVRIFTGAVVPDGVDSVVQQEQVDRDGEFVLFGADCPAGRNVRAIGSDVHRGDTLISAPKKLTASDLALLAGAGIADIRAHRRLNIGFFSTGDELTPLGEPLGHGKIYDSNRYLLSGLLADANHRVVDLGIVRDDPALLEQTLLDAADRFDVVLSTGGASVGDADYVQETLAKCGQVEFWKLAIKPGKPLAFGKIGASWFFGLPGNPAAVLVTFRKFVAPALRQLAGEPAAGPLQLLARCDSRLKKSAGRQEYQRGIVSQIAPGQYAVKLAGGQESHQLTVASHANCFIVLDADCAGVKPGESVIVEPFSTNLPPL
ncbi:gephyrin-like molybdotransferase Glp [Methylomonas sp. MED-D]|uniref:molybdopterin molybdotransferase MoeA n=1 Tax=unclassified Methylomonas TaxID=2608980 RepID=UPI0028A4A549|nr:gephyrin-like molybdotransferase Glp [Methylomonas sp. MV1]MDT4331327.1 molybdopterin molybdotransferase MoeA [Methylomonas sp. MV1]